MRRYRGSLDVDPRPEILVGRARELDLLNRALDDAFAGRGGFVILEGEPGIGKTRLLEETIEAARARAATVFTGAAEELEQTRPFRCLLEAFDIAPKAADTERIQIARLLGAHEAAPEAPLFIAPELQFRVSDAIVDLLELSAATAPVVLALDDLHWADAASLGVLNSAARRIGQLPVLAIAALRSTPRTRELDRVLDALVHNGASYVRVEPLEPDAVFALATDVLGAELGAGLVSSLHKAAGNPLYVVELVRALALEDESLSSDAPATSLPADLRLTLIRRLSVLPSGTIELLRLAAILGPSFSVGDLSLLADRFPASLVPVLDPALKAGFLIERGERLGFRHELIRDAVYLDLPVAVRKALHRDIAHRLAEAGRAPEEVSPHMAVGAEPGDAEAARWLQRAAREAAPRSIRVSIDLLERALAIFPEASKARDAIAAELLVRLVHGSRSEEAEILARELLDRGTGDEHEVLAREGLAVALWQQNKAADARQEWSKIAESPGASESRRAMALADMSQASMGLLDTETAEQQAREALAIGVRVDDRLSVCMAQMTLCLLASARGRTDEAVDLGRRSMDVAESVRAVGEAYPIAELVCGMALLDADAFDEAEAAFRLGRERSDRRGLTSQVPLYYWGMVARNFFVGRWDDALTELEAGLDLVDETGYRAGILVPYALAARMHLSRGSLDAAERYVQEGEREVSVSGTAIGFDLLLWSRALLHEAAGNAEAALGLLELGWDAATPVRYLISYRSLAPDLVRLAVRAERADRARLVTEEVEEGARRSPCVTARAAALRCRGILEGSADLLVASVEAYRDGSRVIDVGLAGEEAASALIDAGRRTEAAALLEESQRTYATLGARRDEARAEASLGALGRRTPRPKPAPRPSFGWEALTSTELQVVGFVMEGLTNPQVGERMFISRRTVQTHLAHIFQKLGLSSRAELAAVAARRAVSREDPDQPGTASSSENNRL